MMIVNSFPQIVKDILKTLPKNDYPVLNSRLYVECWLAYALDNSSTSMRDLFKRLNNTGIDVMISTFSKANTHRSEEIFKKIYAQQNRLVQKKVPNKLQDKYANGIGIHIYASLITYLILHLISIPQKWGNKMLDKFRYLQACMCQKISYVHWMEDIMRC